VSQEPDKEVIAVLENIRRTRVEKGMSILDLADEAEISHSYLFYIESKKKVPTLTVLNKLAKALGVSMKDFFP
jgi:transcriptional regulator with XRE-family HTH domain